MSDPCEHIILKIIRKIFNIDELGNFFIFVVLFFQICLPPENYEQKLFDCDGFDFYFFSDCWNIRIGFIQAFRLV